MLEEETRMQGRGFISQGSTCCLLLGPQGIARHACCALHFHLQMLLRPVRVLRSYAGSTQIRRPTAQRWRDSKISSPADSSRDKNQNLWASALRDSDPEHVQVKSFKMGSLGWWMAAPAPQKTKQRRYYGALRGPRSCYI